MNGIHRLALTISLAVIATLTSCKKDNTETLVVFPLSLYGEKIEVAAATRMFTKNGEIKDPQMIAKFTANQVYFQAENDQSGKGALALTFLSKEKVFFAGSDESYQFSVAQSGEQFLFTSEMLYIAPSVIQDNFRNHLFKHEHVISSGPSGGVQSREVRVGYGSHKGMRMPLLAYCTSTGNGSAFFKTAGMNNNEFNEAALSYLQTNDTLAVKSYHLICKPK